MFEKSLVRQKREEEDARIKEELSKQEQKSAPKMEKEERQTSAKCDDDAKFNWWYANINLNEGQVVCEFNMLQLYFAHVNGTSKPFKEKLNQILRLNHY